LEKAGDFCHLQIIQMGSEDYPAPYPMVTEDFPGNRVTGV